ncbi:MAG: nucleoside monophosphate kinase [Candidatus Spechtbacteria bacterium]|nr:nucleoside monophosphate kinase [Candidatus Spechtbacteria bacterium]
MTSTDQKIAVILLGPPGAGKGTQAERLAKKFSLHMVATSAILHEKIKNAVDDPEAQEAKRVMERGELVDSKLVTKWIIEEIAHLAEKGASIIFDGSPRTLYEAEQEYYALKREYDDNIYVFFISIPEEEIIFRNVHRRTCEQCKRSLIYSEETERLTACPYCGGKLIHRVDDDPEVIKARIEQYNSRTMPVVNYFKDKKILIEIDGKQSVDMVFEDIVESIMK